MVHAVLVATLITFVAIADASGQTTPAGSEGFGGLGGARSIIVVDDAGVETTGRLLRLTADELSMSADGREHTFPRRQVAAIYERGDSLKNGALIGAISGGALGFAAGTQDTCGDFWTGVRSCSTSEKLAHGAFGGLLIGALGGALGAGIDALIPGRKTLYEQPAQTAPATGETFSGLPGGRTVSVIDHTGWETTGRLLLFTPDTMTVAVNGSEVVFDRKDVKAVYERGNSIKKGVIIGALSGPVLGVAAMATDGPSAEIAVGTVIFSALGIAVGAAIDAAIPGKHLVYESGRRVSIAPTLSRAGLGLSTSVSW